MDCLYVNNRMLKLSWASSVFLALFPLWVWLALLIILYVIYAADSVFVALIFLLEFSLFIFVPEVKMF